MSLFIKICGITSVEDALRASELGASAIGLNFWPSSKRHVTRETATEIARALPPGVLKVGVFVNASAEAVRHAEHACGLDLVQFHGDEVPALCAEWGARAICAVRLRSVTDLDQIAQYRNARMILVDAVVEGAYGGTGVTANWQLARQARETGASILLAGGLTPENVAEAIRAVGPAGVDVAGGVESAPGIKDAEKMRAFIAAAKKSK